jgi:hypothetical protein
MVGTSNIYPGVAQFRIFSGTYAILTEVLMIFLSPHNQRLGEYLIVNDNARE